MGVIAERRAGSPRLFGCKLKQNVELKVNSPQTVRKELPATFFVFILTHAMPPRLLFKLELGVFLLFFFISPPVAVAGVHAGALFSKCG